MQSRIIKSLLFCNVFLMVLFSGCSSPPADLSPLVNEYKETYPRCSTKEDCAELWEKSITWIKNNTDLGIDIETDDLIQTYTLNMKNKKLVKVVDGIIYADERDRVRKQEYEVDENRGNYEGPEIKLIKRYVGSNNYRLELMVACGDAWIYCENSLLEQIRFNREIQGDKYPFPESATEQWLIEYK